MRMILLLLFFLPQKWNTYTVVRTVGNIECARIQPTIKPRDILSDTDRLVFGHPEDYLILSSPRGLFQVGGTKDTKQHSLPNIFTQLNELIIPHNEIRITGIKKTAINSTFDLRTFLGSLNNNDIPTIIITNKTVLGLNPNSFTDTANNFFYLRYKNGNSDVNIRLPYTPAEHNNQFGLSIDSSLMPLLNVGKIDILTLHYYHTQKEESTLISPIRISAIDPRLEQEVEILYKDLQLKYSNAPDKDQAITDHIYAYILKIYGYTNKELAYEMLKKVQSK